MKCYKCKREINIVSSFRCALCGNNFCAEHRLPENHQCPEFPILLYQKKKKIKESFAALGLCPKCRSPATDMIHYDAKTMTFECKECGHKYTRLKKFPHPIIETKLKVEEKVKKPKQRKAVKKIKHIFAGIFLLLIIIGVIAAIIFGIIAWFYPQAIMCTVINTNNVEDKIFELINEERANRGLPILIRDSALANAAKEWSQHMAETGTVEHGDFENRMAELGYYEGCGEICGMHNGWAISLARSLVNGWLNSQGHREIMLTSLDGYMGVGVSKSISGFYGVVDFHFNY